MAKLKFRPTRRSVFSGVKAYTVCRSPENRCNAVGWTFCNAILVEHFGAEVGKCWPGDQDGRDKGEDAEDGHDSNSVAGFYIINDVGCGFHDVSPIASL